MFLGAVLGSYRLINEILRANRALESLLGKVKKNELDGLSYRSTLLFVPETGQLRGAERTHFLHTELIREAYNNRYLVYLGRSKTRWML